MRKLSFALPGNLVAASLVRRMEKPREGTGRSGQGSSAPRTSNDFDKIVVLSVIMIMNIISF